MRARRTGRTVSLVWKVWISLLSTFSYDLNSMDHSTDVQTGAKDVHQDVRRDVLRDVRRDSDLVSLLHVAMLLKVSSWVYGPIKHRSKFGPRWTVRDRDQTLCTDVSFISIPIMLTNSLTVVWSYYSVIVVIFWWWNLGNWVWNHLLKL